MVFKNRCDFYRFRGRLHVRFCARIAVRFRVRFPAQGGLQFNLEPIFPEMGIEAVELMSKG
jgi:hypothetical protein